MNSINSDCDDLSVKLLDPKKTFETRIVEQHFRRHIADVVFALREVNKDLTLFIVLVNCYCSELQFSGSILEHDGTHFFSYGEPFPSLT